MSRVGLATYTIRVREQGDTTVYEQLDSMFGSHDLVVHIRNWLAKLEQNPKRLDSSRKHLEVDQIFSGSEPRGVIGFFGAGDFGSKTKIVKAGTRQARDKPKEKDESTPVPLYFNFHVPSSSKIGFLVLQTYAGQRIKGHIQGLIDGHLREKMGKMLIVEMKHFVTADRLINLLNASNIAQVRLYRRGLSQDLATQVGNKNQNKEPLEAQAGRMSFVMNPTGYDVSKLRTLIARAVRKEIKPADILETDFLGETQDELRAKIVLSSGSTRRVLNLQNWEETFHLDYDVTAQAKPEATTGFPDRNILKTLGDKLMREAVSAGLA